MPRAMAVPRSSQATPAEALPLRASERLAAAPFPFVHCPERRGSYVDRMVEPASRDVSLGGSAAEAPKRRPVASLRRYYGILLAFVTLVCASLAGVPQQAASARTGSTLDAVDAVLDSTGAVQWALASGSSHHLRGGADPSDVDLEGIESDSDDNDDDDGDPRHHVADHGAAAVDGIVFPRRPGRAWSREPERDTSRFASGIGLPRGPPV
jgi:hypothetical protein